MCSNENVAEVRYLRVLVDGPLRAPNQVAIESLSRLRGETMQRQPPAK